ncbi:MAG: hypothetical protein RLO50_04430 [Azospirillaceae bacterium]
MSDSASAFPRICIDALESAANNAREARDFLTPLERNFLDLLEGLDELHLKGAKTDGCTMISHDQLSACVTVLAAVRRRLKALTDDALNALE